MLVRELRRFAYLYFIALRAPAPSSTKNPAQGYTIQHCIEQKPNHLPFSPYGSHTSKPLADWIPSLQQQYLQNRISFAIVPKFNIQVLCLDCVDP